MHFITQSNRKWWVLGALGFGNLVIGLDLTILSVALPTLATSLHASTGDLQWFISIYNLVMAAMLLPAGLLGDRFGAKKLLLWALVLFGLSSLACAYAASAGQMILARAALGLAAAFMMPLATSVMTALFPPAERQKAVGVTVLANTLGIPLGPIIGGLLLNHFWWGSVFLINVPIVGLALLAGVLLIPKLKGTKHISIDARGIMLSSLGLVALTYGFIAAGDQGWGSLWVLAPIAAGSLGLVAFGLRERALYRKGANRSLIDLSLFKSASYLWGAILATVMSFAMFGILFTMPQFFQAVYGADALGTGLRLLPVIGGLIIGAQLADRIPAKAGAKITVALGFGIMAIGLLAESTTGVSTGYWIVGSWLAIIGIGIGFVLPGAMGAALAALSPQRSGVGSAVIHALRMVGGGLGVALLGTVLNGVYRGHLTLAGLPDAITGPVKESVAAGVSIAQQLQNSTLLDSIRGSFVHAMDIMLLVCAIISALGAILAIIFLPRRTVLASQANQKEANHVNIR